MKNSFSTKIQRLNFLARPARYAAFLTLMVAACADHPTDKHDDRPADEKDVPTGVVEIPSYRTTSSSIAINNLNATLDGLLVQLSNQAKDPLQPAKGLVHHLLLRAEVFGRIDDMANAKSLAERMVTRYPSEPEAYLLRARVLTALHLFEQALDDLAKADELAGTPVGKRQRFGVYVALGRIADAEALLNELKPVLTGLTGLALRGQLAAEKGDTFAAAEWFEKASQAYEDVSPFPLAWLHTVEGRFWRELGNLNNAELLLRAAIKRLPAYAPAQGQLAELEAETGKVEAAIARLKPLAENSQDPDYAAQLARILIDSGQADVAQRYIVSAQERFTSLYQRFPAAYADHGTDFWLAAGADAAKAMTWASTNFGNRKTVRGWRLGVSALAAQQPVAGAERGSLSEFCQFAQQLQKNMPTAINRSESRELAVLIESCT